MQRRIAPTETATAAVLSDWNDVKIILAAARSRSFAEAASMLGTTQPTISRRIAYIEHRIGMPLFKRTRRGAEVTESGRSILEAAERMEAAARVFDQHMARLDPMAGNVTVAAGDGVVSYILMPEMTDFLRKHPGLGIRFLTVGEPNANFPWADVSVIPMPPGARLRMGSALKVRLIGRVTFVAHAARSYLGVMGRPAAVEDLRRHRLVDLPIYSSDRGFDRWRRIIEDRGPCAWPVSVVESTSILHRAIRQCLGIGLLPSFASHIDPDLVPLPLGLPQMALDFWLVAHEDNLRTPRVRTTFDFIVETFRKRPDWFRVAQLRSDIDAIAEHSAGPAHRSDSPDTREDEGAKT